MRWLWATAESRNMDKCRCSQRPADVVIRDEEYDTGDRGGRNRIEVVRRGYVVVVGAWTGDLSPSFSVENDSTK